MRVEAPVKRLRVAAALFPVCVIIVSLAGCGSNFFNDDGGPMSPAELSDCLTQMMRDTAKATSVAERDQTEKRELRTCSAPSEPQNRYDAMTIYLPTVDLEDARVLMGEMHDYWQSVASGWSREGYEVVDDGIETKETAAVFLSIDGFTLTASYFPDADVAEFVFAGSAPCAEHPDDQRPT